ncbi:MAG: ornithine carbamoyltransferase [Tagaea sp.]
MPKHFLDIDALETSTLRLIIDLGVKYKAQKGSGPAEKPLAGKTLAMIFEKPSTRTRVSFEVGIRQLGGEAVILTHHDTQLGRGETIADTARVLSRYCDAIMLRTNKASHLEEMVRHASVPVINGLTERSHPCQVMADVMTFEEKKGSIADKVVTWTGDGNNVAVSWIHAAKRFAFELRLACPEPLRPPEHVLAWARREGARIQLLTDPEAAVRGADAVVTDTWVSMDQEGSARERENREKRHNMLVPYRVNEELMALAKPDAMFLHCLPAHRGEEVTAAVIDGPQSAVWDEAENRLHVQKGILAWCMA